MGGTGSVVRRFHIEIAWGIFACANLVAMFVFPVQATVPFHFIWISLTLVYGYRTWDSRPTLIVLGLVMLTTTFGEVHATREWAELSEIPLMAAMFLAMVWHARRRQRAIEDLRVGAERERDFLRDASHHLRTPITIAVGHAEIVRDVVEDPRAVDDVDVVLDELHNLGEIANRILMLATADHPEYLRPEPLAVDAFVQRVGDRWCIAADRDWQIDCGSAAVITADRDQIERSLDAILENSVNHTTRRRQHPDHDLDRRRGGGHHGHRHRFWHPPCALASCLRAVLRDQHGVTSRDRLGPRDRAERRGGPRGPGRDYERGRRRERP